MKKLVSVTAVAAIAGSAFGLAETVDRSGYAMYDESNLPSYVTITKVALDAPRTNDRAGTAVFDGMAGGSGYVASPAGTTTLGIEDYVTSLGDGVSDGIDNTGGTFALLEYGFAGGVTAPGGTLFFDFFDVGLSFATGFGVSLTSAGNFLYTISIGAPAATQVPVEGIHLITPDVGSAGQWFLSDGGASPGAHGVRAETDFFGTGGLPFTFDYGAGPQVINQNFRLNVPTPGAAALFGLAGVAGLRRRR